MKCKKGYLCSSLNRPVPMVIGMPMMMHSLTPEITIKSYSNISY